jgi:hypothetical protein
MFIRLARLENLMGSNDGEGCLDESTKADAAAALGRFDL